MIDKYPGLTEITTEKYLPDQPCGRVSRTGPAFVQYCLPRRYDAKEGQETRLNRETVRNLSTDDLKKIAGGSEVSVPRSCCRTCIICDSSN